MGPGRQPIAASLLIRHTQKNCTRMSMDDFLPSDDARVLAEADTAGHRGGWCGWVMWHVGGIDGRN